MLLRWHPAHVSSHHLIISAIFPQTLSWDCLVSLSVPTSNPLGCDRFRLPLFHEHVQLTRPLQRILSSSYIRLTRVNNIPHQKILINTYRHGQLLTSILLASHRVRYGSIPNRLPTQWYLQGKYSFLLSCVHPSLTRMNSCPTSHPSDPPAC